MSVVFLFLFLAFSVWLVARDCTRRKAVSGAMWIPTILLMILGSRPVSLWASGGRVVVNEMGNDVSGSPLDMLFFVLVLAASLAVASSRRFNWSKLFGSNAVIVLFYLYFFASTLWSSDPTGSIKRIVKDFGLLFVVGLIYSEKDPLLSIRAIYYRCAAVLIPLSVVLVKYFPWYSRSFSVAGVPTVTGVTTQKNSLGEIVLLLTIIVVWDALEMMREGTQIHWKRMPWDRVLLVLFGVWLLRESDSKTAMLCVMVGSFLIVRSGKLMSRTANRLALFSGLSLPYMLFFSQQFSSVIAPVVEALGRNMTFTGRTDIWSRVTIHTVNPLIGAGYWNFWGGPGGFAISQAMHTPIPNAHCGYLDIYIDGGMIGLGLLFTIIIVNGNRIIGHIFRDGDEDRFLRGRLAILVVAMI
jgi:exopolysaccharide production protein ExoQ